MRYLVVVFGDSDLDSYCITSTHDSGFDADTEAKKHLAEHPEDLVHVYSWRSGFYAEKRVDVMTEFGPPTKPVQELPPAAASGPVDAGING